MFVIIRKNNIILIFLIVILITALFYISLMNSDAKYVSNIFTRSRTVLLDPGHGGEDPGAVSDYSGIKEKDINLKIAMIVKGLLEKDGYNVIMTREDDVLVYEAGTSNVVQKRKQDLIRRKDMMDNDGADIVVSIHLNKFPQEKYFGAQAFYPKSSVESANLAISIQNAIKEMADPENNRKALAKDESIIILKNTKTTTAIVECGFLSNRQEEEKIQDDEYQNILAAAIKTGIDNYFNDN